MQARAHSAGSVEGPLHSRISAELSTWDNETGSRQAKQEMVASCNSCLGSFSYASVADQNCTTVQSDPDGVVR